MIVINNSMKKLGLLSIIASFFGCMEPNSEDIWTLNKLAQVDTEGYCRDVYISGDSVFVAAGQAGVQLYDVSTITAPTLVWSMSLSDLGVSKEISQVEYEPSIKQLFALESNERPIHLDLSKGDTVSVVGQFSSEKTKEFRVITHNDTTFTLYAADNDDGLKTNTFEFDSSFELWFNTAGSEISSVGNPNGIDIINNTIVLTLDQLGYEIFTMNGSTITSNGAVDLSGNSRAVTMVNENEFYVSSEDAGAYHISNSTKEQFAEGLYVTHVTFNGKMVALSTASNGLTLYDLSSSGSHEERGIHDIGYVYHAEFANNLLFAATREGLQILEIVE